MDKPNVFFNIRKGVDTEVYKASNLKQIKAALKKLGVYDQSYTVMSGMSDPLTSDYIGIYFFSDKPNNVDDSMIDSLGDIPIKGKTLALFLYQQFTDPALILYESIPHAKLGGWELWGQSVNGETYLACERTLIQRMN